MWHNQVDYRHQSAGSRNLVGRRSVILQFPSHGLEGLSLQLEQLAPATIEDMDRGEGHGVVGRIRKDQVVLDVRMAVAALCVEWLSDRRHNERGGLLLTLRLPIVVAEHRRRSRDHLSDQRTERRRRQEGLRTF